MNVILAVTIIRFSHTVPPMYLRKLVHHHLLGTNTSEENMHDSEKLGLKPMEKRKAVEV